MADVPNREELIRKVVGLCNRIPGSTQWNAAEWMYDELSALLSERERRTAQGVTVPAGWKLVPIEPTEEMIAAGRVARLNIQGGYSGGPSSWEAMLNAAPSLSTSAGGGERG